MSIAQGTKLGQYEVQDFLGQGAMGLVYRAYHPQLERTVAVKVLQAISPDADTVARFRHEAQAIARLRHPNIVDVYDFGEFQGTPYMIVEYVPGGSLAAKMNRGQLEPAAALRYLRGIAAGLDYAHSHGVVHRDVKPANVLLTLEDTPVLADFGLAKLMQGSSLKSMTGVTTGTPAYMAPEQVAGRNVTPAADRYSLATIAYEMLTGVIPFDGEALMELLYAQVHREPPLPSSRHAALGPQVDAVVMRGLAKDPAARWESCTAFVEALAGAMNGLATPGLHVAKTMVLAPPAVPSTVPLAAAAMPATAPMIPLAPPAPARTPRRDAPATVAMPFPTPPAAPAAGPSAAAKSQGRRNRQIAMGAAAALVLLIVMGTCAVLAQATTLTVTPNRAARDETVSVHATHVPANKAGELQLWSVVHTFPFQADSNGNATTDITIPRDVALGDHVVKICWDNACHAQAPLKVVAGIAQVAPTPVGNPTPGTTPTPTPHAGSTPTPTGTSTPTPRSGGGGGGGGGSTPTPAPPPNPCPSNTNALVLSPPSQSVLLGGSASWSGSNFTPNTSVTVSYYSPSTSLTPTKTWTVTASCSGTFTTSTSVPGGLLRTDKITACDLRKGCVSATVSVVA